jgi:2-amino-4-hydroxy-6-hydroxymethyldihydropteridine diphosphokinase
MHPRPIAETRKPSVPSVRCCIGILPSRDLIALWSGGKVRSRRLTIPHYGLETRPFVIHPLAAIAPSWRIRGGLTARHLAHRLGRRAASAG